MIMSRRGSVRWSWAVALACVAGAAQAQTAIHVWYGSNSTDWADASNWKLPEGAVPGNVTTNVRLQVQTIAGGYDLVYGAAQGTTIFNTTAGGTPRSFLIYPAATFRIEGGVFEARGTQPDLIGVNAGLSRMVIAGGTYIRTNDVASAAELQFGFNANSTGILEITSGEARVRAMTLGLNGGNHGEVWLSGGMLEAGAVTKGGGTGIFFFDGGTFRASQANLDWIGSGLPVRITGNGAVIDTAGYDVGIQRHLVNSNGAGGLTVYGGGRLTISAGTGNIYAGDTIVSNATLRLGANSSIPNGAGIGNVVLLDGATLDLGGFGDTINGLNGGGTIDNTLDVGSYTLTVCDNNASGTFTGGIHNTSGTLNLTKTGTGTLLLGASNSYDGVTAVSGGSLIITHGHALGSAAGGTTVANNQRLILSGGITVENEALTISGTGNDSLGALRATNGIGTWTGPVTLGLDMTRIAAIGGGLTVSGAIGDGGAGYGLRVRNPNGDASVIQLSGANTYGGRTEIWQGIVRLAGGDDRLPTGQSVLLGYQDGGGNWLVGNLDLNGVDQRITGLEINPNITDPTLASRQAVTNSAAATTSTLTVSNETDYTFGGRIVEGAGSLALVKQGAGTLSLNGNNTYAGATTIAAGTLAVNGTYSGGGLITVLPGGTLGGTGAVGAVTISTGGELAPGASLGTLSAASVTWDGGATWAFELGGDGASSDRLALSGSLTRGAAGAFAFDFLGSGVNGGVYTLVTFGSTTFSESDFSCANLAPGLTGTFEQTSSELTLTVVPEPGTLGVLGLGIVAMVLRRRRG
jgi:autotransporter-associated beta strand protein